MIELKIRLSDGNGLSRVIWDYLVSSMQEKLRHACEVCGVLNKYMSGSVSSGDFRGKRGKLRLGVEKDKTGVYAPKNLVRDYVASKDTFRPKRNNCSRLNGRRRVFSWGPLGRYPPCPAVANDSGF